MSRRLTLYTLEPESYPAKVFAEYLTRDVRCPVRLLPLSQLPPPSPARLSALRLTQQDLREQLAGVELGIGYLESGACAPTPRDAQDLQGLRYRADALASRLRAIAATLQAQEGGVANG